MEFHDDEETPMFFFCDANILRGIDADKRVPFILKNRVGDLLNDPSLNKRTIKEIALDLNTTSSKVLSMRDTIIRKIKYSLWKKAENRKLPSTISSKEFFIEFLKKNPGDVLELDVRTTNGLINERIETIYDLVTKTQIELLKIPNIGRVSICVINKALAPYDLYIGMNPDLLNPERWTVPSDKEYRDRLDAAIPEVNLEQAKKYRQLKTLYGERGIESLLDGSGVIIPAQSITIKES